MALVSEDLLQSSSDSFWEVDGYKPTVKRVEDGSLQCSELMKMVQERADIERDYAKRLKMWAKKWNESFDRGPEYGTNKNTLKGALDEADHIADVHLTIKNRLLSEVQAEIKEWRNDNYKKQMVGVCKETKTFEDEFHKAQKPWSKRYSKVIKSKKDYHMACKLERTASNQENNARNSSDMSADQVKKLQDKVEKCRKDVDMTRERYRQSLTELNSYNAKYIEDMTEVFQRTQEFEHRRLTFIKKMLYDLLACVDITQYKALPEIYVQLRHTIDQSNGDHDLHWWSQFRGVGMMMSWPTFEEYSPELTDISRKKCSDVWDTGTVTLRKIAANKTDDDFEYSPEFHSISNRREHAGNVFTASQNKQNETSPSAADGFSTSPNRASVMPSSQVDSSTEKHDEFVSLTSNTADTISAGGGVPVRALFDYKAQEPDELSFTAGDRFTKVKERDEQGWCTGCKDGRVGLYPHSYVEQLI